MYMVPHGRECSRLPRDIIMLLNAVQQFLLQAPREMFSEHERQGAQHELGEKHEYYQAEILKITDLRVPRFSKSFLIILIPISLSQAGRKWALKKNTEKKILHILCNYNTVHARSHILCKIYRSIAYYDTIWIPQVQAIMKRIFYFA